MTYNRGKIVNDEDPRDFIYIHYIPEELTENTSAEYNEQGGIIGRSAPYIFYANTQARTFEFPFYLMAQSNAEEEVKKRVRWLQSFLFPDYSVPVIKPPKMLRLFIGRDFVNFRGVLKDCPVTWRAPYDVLTGVSMYAEISISIQEVVDIPYSYQDFKPAALRRLEGVLW